MKVGIPFQRNAIMRNISALVLATVCSISAHAAVITTSGTLPDAPLGAYNLFSFSVTTGGSTALSLTGNTDSWLGLFSGTNVLSNATFIGQDDDGGVGLNSLLVLNLAAGNYTAWITSHGSFWDTASNSIIVGHDHTPMNYTLSVEGNVAAANDVPEPASMGLLALGLAGLAASRRRKG
jgi:hypothetical protein